MASRFEVTHVADEKGLTFSITGIKDRVLVYGFAVLIGGSSAFNLVVPKRPDPFTGTQGRELRTLIDERYSSVDKRLDQLLTITVVNANLIESNEDADNEWRKDHLVWGRKLRAVQAEFNGRAAANIEELQRHLGHP